MKQLLSWIVPYTVWVKLRLWRMEQKKPRLVVTQKRGAAAQADYGLLIDELVSYGCDESQVREGSMPEESLKAVVTLLEQNFGSSAIQGLHIGNFVGVSLTFLTLAIVKRHAESQMVSIDPNIEHRGIDRPMEQVIRLLNQTGMQGNSLVLTGYSLQKSLSNDGLHYTPGYDPKSHFASELSCEKQLPQLAALCGEKFHFAVLDGNHEGGYFERELVWVDKLLRPGGLMVVDDVSETWIEIQEVFRRFLAGDGYEKVFQDGRIGVLRKKG
jgi:hypothetical protein